MVASARNSDFSTGTGQELKLLQVTRQLCANVD